MRLVGREFKPKEPYTHRIRKILEEYPDGSQVLREILQNSTMQGVLNKFLFWIIIHIRRISYLNQIWIITKEPIY